MKLKIGQMPSRKPVRVVAALEPAIHSALVDYAAIHAQEFGSETQIGDLAGLMIERFLDSDPAFKRARKSLRNNPSKRSEQ